MTKFECISGRIAKGFYGKAAISDENFAISSSPEAIKLS